MTDKAIISVEQKAKQLDQIASDYARQMEERRQDTPFSSALVITSGITALRELLDDGIMKEIMKLADSPLGFMTDQSTRPRPYSPIEIRDAIIEAGLRGFRVAGNEFNIISGRFYAAKSGLHRKIVSYPGVTDFKEALGIPKLHEKGAVINAKATWIKDGIRDQLERELAIRVNVNMGVDAILGKAQRKLYAAVLNQLSGIQTPDGEIDDARELAAQPAQVIPGSAELPKRSPGRPRKQPDPEPEAAEAEVIPADSGGVSDRFAMSREVLKRLAELGVTSDRFLRVLHEKAHVIGPDIKTVDAVPLETLRMALDDWDNVRTHLADLPK